MGSVKSFVSGFVTAGALFSAVLLFVNAASVPAAANATPGITVGTTTYREDAGSDIARISLHKWNSLIGIRVGGTTAYRDLFTRLVPGKAFQVVDIADYRSVYAWASGLRRESPDLLDDAARMFLRDMENPDASGTFGEAVRSAR